MAAISAGSEAFNLTYTIDIDTFSYYADGEWLFGLELGTTTRYGSDQHRFDDLAEHAGITSRSDPTYVSGPRFVQLAFGITLTRELFERDLPSLVIDPRAYRR
jgi:hypothetical protein